MCVGVGSNIPNEHMRTVTGSELRIDAAAVFKREKPQQTNQT